jgi:hypothetical protein
VLTRVKLSSFQYLINCAVPAIFGYFISEEHLIPAIQFYHCVIEYASENAAIAILQPLLHSTATFRFLESAFSDFIRFLVIDVNCGQSSQTAYLGIYTSFLMKSIMESLPLLPQGILNLLSAVQEANWSTEKVSLLIFHKFLWLAAMQFLRNSSTPRHLATLRQVLEAITQNPAYVSEIYSKIQLSNSIFSLPQIYLPFGHQFVDFFLSVHDVHAIAIVLNACKMMPDTCTLPDLTRVPQLYKYHWFVCQVYERTQRRPTNEIGSLFSDESPDTSLIEKLIVRTLFKKVIRDWLDILQTHEDIVVAPFVTDLAVQSIAQPFQMSLSLMKEHLNIPRLSKRIYLAIVEQRFPQWVDKSLITLLALLDVEFHRKLKTLPEGDGVVQFPAFAGSLRSSLRPLLLDAVRSLACLDSSILNERLRILLRVMQQVMLVLKLEEKPDSVYPVIFQQNRGEQLLSTFLILNTFVMKDLEFARLCSDNEKRIWVKLESVVLLVLRSDKVFLNAYITVQEQLAAVAAAELA